MIFVAGDALCTSLPRLVYAQTLFPSPPIHAEVIYVAGDRVVTDALCKPFSMGRNLFCVHSKVRCPLNFSQRLLPVLCAPCGGAAMVSCCTLQACFVWHARLLHRLSSVCQAEQPRTCRNLLAAEAH